MTLSDVNTAVHDILAENFDNYRLYSQARVENIKRPAFVYFLHPVSMEPSGRNTRHVVMTLVIDYFQSVKNMPDAENAIIKIRDALGWSFAAGDGYANVTDFDWSYTGTERNIPEINATLEWFEAVNLEKPADTMEILQLKTKLKEEV